jgi:hypothetical protein
LFCQSFVIVSFSNFLILKLTLSILRWKGYFNSYSTLQLLIASFS